MLDSYTKDFQSVKDLKSDGKNPDPNAGIDNLERHMENISLTIFWFVCLQSMQISFKHVGFVILIVLNKNSVILFYLEGR